MKKKLRVLLTYLLAASLLFNHLLIEVIALSDIEFDEQIPAINVESNDGQTSVISEGIANSLEDTDSTQIQNNLVDEVTESGENEEQIFSDIEITSDMTLEVDTEVGNLNLVSGNLNLNGHRLVVHGSVNHSNGNMIINKGELIVEGNYTLVRGASGRLTMTNVNDYVKVGGNFYTEGMYSHNGYLTKGVLEVKGDFTQRKYSNTYNFKATGEHRVILSGEGLQTVDFENAQSMFNILEIGNYSDDGVVFKMPLNASELITNGLKVTFPNGEALGRTLTEDETIEGDLYLAGEELNLDGYSLMIKGDLIQSGGTVNINGGTLTIEGDYRLQSMSVGNDGTKTYGYSTGCLDMTDEADYVKVYGSFITQSQHDHSNNLTDGTLEVGGDFEQKRFVTNKNFSAGDNHKVILNGDELQTVKFSDPSSSNSCFNILEISNSSTEGVKFETKTVVVDKLIQTETAVTGAISLAGTASIEENSWGYDLIIDEERTLSENMYIGGSLTVSNNLNLNGSKLMVGKNVSHTRGKISIEGGNLEVGGDYTITNGSFGRLVMTNPDDYMKVGGNFYTEGRYSHNGYLTVEQHFNIVLNSKLKYQQNE